MRRSSLAVGLGTCAGLLVLGGLTAAEDHPSPAAPSMTPDDAWVIFRWPMVGNDDGIWVSRADGRERHELLAHLPGGQASPDWSPDGTRIVFAERTPAEAIWIADADGSNAQEIVPSFEGCCGQDHAYWSPDGGSIAFVRWLGPEDAITSQVMVYRLADGSLDVLAAASAPMVIDHPRWSPDGSRLAVELSVLGPDGAYTGGSVGLVDIASGAITSITDPAAFGGWPNWSPDGRSLVFETHGLAYSREGVPGHATDLYTVLADGSEMRQLTHNAPGGQRASQPFWRADGTIAYIETDSSADGPLHLRYLTTEGEQLPDPAIPILASYPRFRPGS